MNQVVVSERTVCNCFKVSNIPPEDYIENIQDAAVYLKDLWDRLNGGGRSASRSLLDDNIPRAVSSENVCKTAMSQLSLELERIEKRLQVGASFICHSVNRETSKPLKLAGFI